MKKDTTNGSVDSAFSKNTIAKASSQNKEQQLNSADFTFTKWVDKLAVMKEFDITERTLYNLRKKHKIPFGRFGARIYYDRCEMERMLKKGWDYSKVILVMLSGLLQYFG